MTSTKTEPALDEFFDSLENWGAEAKKLRTILRRCPLEEVLKWRKPCYAHKGDNIAIIQPFKNFLALLFFKGALLDDPDGLLESQGKNTRSALRLCFTSVKEVSASRAAIEAFVAQAIEVERQGLTVDAPSELVLADELRARLDRNKKLKAAFEALTPGRQREYNLFISGAKQAKTRAARVEKHVERILAGKGLRDR